LLKKQPQEFQEVVVFESLCSAKHLSTWGILYNKDYYRTSPYPIKRFTFTSFYSRRDWPFLSLKSHEEIQYKHCHRNFRKASHYYPNHNVL